MKDIVVSSYNLYRHINQESKLIKDLEGVSILVKKDRLSFDGRKQEIGIRSLVGDFVAHVSTKQMLDLGRILVILPEQPITIGFEDAGMYEKVIIKYAAI